MATNQDNGTGGTQARSKASSFGRDRLARLVVVGSFLTLFLMVASLIWLSQGTGKGEGVAEKAFNSILPVLAGWVGTVLAFYFSSANQEKTNDILERTIGRVANQTTDGGALASEKMIPLARIVGKIAIGKGAADDGKGGDKAPSDVTLADMQAAFAKPLSNGGTVTRLLFVERDVFKFIVHESTLHALIVKSIDRPPQTLADLLGDPVAANQVSKLVAFVSARATLAEAKAALDSVPGALDIIVTPTGNATEPMLGWLSNTDLTRALDAR